MKPCPLSFAPALGVKLRLWLRLGAVYGLGALLFCLCTSGLKAEPPVLQAGAQYPVWLAPLVFVNGDQFGTNSGYINTLSYTNAGKYAGSYQGSLDLMVLPATDPYGGPSPSAAQVGSFIQADIFSVVGPAGGVFSFWEPGSNQPAFSLGTGQIGSGRFALTEPHENADPYGHIQGRTFTASKPGIYTVAFQLVDTSVGPWSEGPLHSPSDVLHISFQAGISIAAVTKTPSGNVIRFGTCTNSLFAVESCTNISSPNWTIVATNLTGMDRIQSVIDPDVSAPRKFYRVRSP